MAFKKQLVTSCKQAIWGEILGGNAPNYATRFIFSFVVSHTTYFFLLKKGTITIGAQRINSFWLPSR